MADFHFYLNRQGAKGEKGDKGDKGDTGNTPIPSTGTNTPTEYTIIWDLGDGNSFETGNLKQPTVDQGGTTLRYDRANDQIILGEPDLASTSNMTPGIVYLADDERIENEDVQDDDAVTYKVFKDKADDLKEQITDVKDDLDDLADVVNQNSDDIESLDGRLDDEEANMLIVQGDITTLNETKASKTELSSGLATKANVVHNHTMSQITDAGSLAKKNTVDYQTEVTNKPNIGDGTITFKQGNTTVGTITTNQLNNSTITFTDPTGVTPGDGLNLDSSTNTLSVKVDNDTLGINSNGEIEVQNAGTTYSEGDAIDLGNDTISVKYDNNTLKLNGSGQLYADIPAANDAIITITQGGITKGTFTTNQNTDATIALDAGPDMSGYYTKTQTDSLLDGKISTNIVQYPLQYSPDTTDAVNSLNDTNLTISRINGDNNNE